MAFSPDEALQLIAGAVQRGRLAHAFLIQGPLDADQREVAVHVANLVNGWRAGSLNDLRALGAYVVEPESKRRLIEVDQLRDLEKRLQLSSLGNYNIGVIVDADRATQQASNAFLKTLEEPPQNTLLFLLSTQPEQLLETVRSRCVRVPLYRSDKDGVSLTPDQERLVDALARHFSGELSTARALVLLKEFQDVLGEIKEQIKKENEAAYKEEVEAYAKTTDGSWLKLREDYYEDLAAAQYQQQRVSLLSVLFTWFGELLRRQTGSPAFDLPKYAAATARAAQNFPVTEVLHRLRAIEELRRNLTTNVREALALEVAFLKAFG